MTDSNGMYMPVAPAYGGYGNDGMFGGNGAWWIIILLAVLGWGNGFGGGVGGNGGAGNGFVNAEVQRGFDQQSVMTGLNGVHDAVNTGFGNVQTALCNGFANVNQGVASGFANTNQTIANGFAQAEIAANARQVADMQQNFQLQSDFQNCCCENRLASANLLNTINQDGAATRAAGAANTQAILDKLCQLELDGVKQNYEGQIRAMQAQLAAAQNDITGLRLAASQTAQTAQILANNEAQTSALEQYLAPVPRPAYIVQNPNLAGFGYGGCGGYAA